MTTQKRHQLLQVQHDCGPTEDGQFEWRQQPNWMVKPVDGIPTFPTTTNVVKSKGRTFKTL